MKLRDTLRGELRPTLELAGPLVLAEVGWMAMGIVDTMVVGRVSAEAIGAVSLGSVLYYTVGISGSGLLLGLDTLVAQSFGARNRDDCRHSLINAAYLTLAVGPALMAVVWLMGRMLGAFGVHPGVLGQTVPYLDALNWSTLPLMLYFASRRYLQAMNIVRPIMFTLLTANLVNLAANWVLVFGNLGAPRLGAEGSGWATCISRVYMAAVLGGVIFGQEGMRLVNPTRRPDFARIRKLVALGLPVALQFAVEIGVFATVTVLISRLGPVVLAGHQIALNTVSMTFMVPLGISSAAAVRVGQAIGRGDPHGAGRAGWTALGLGAAVMACAAVTLLTVPRAIARAFTPDAGIIEAGAVLLMVAAFFQLFDGLQVVATGALRGAGDTRTPVICHLLGYWAIGLPLGATLCFRWGLGAAGLWAGLSLALILIGIVLASVWARKVREVTSPVAQGVIL